MNDIREEHIDIRDYWKWIIILVFVVIFLLIAIPNIIHQQKSPHPGMSCSGQLRNLGAIIRKYYENNNHYPQNLEVLVEQKYLKEIPRCWIEEKPYLYQVNGWDSEDFTVSCPNPEEHVGSSGPKSITASLYYHAKEGVVQVDK